MKKLSLASIICTAVLIVGCKNENTTPQERVDENMDQTQEGIVDDVEMDEGREIIVELEPKNGSDLSGTVAFTEEGDEVVMTGRIYGLEAGPHAIHLHEEGDCSADDATSAGGHWNPTNEEHGEWGDEEGFHRGDIGNIEINSDGVGEVNFSTDLWCIGCGDETRDILGQAVIVHRGVDDFVSQPSGDAGMRVGCGVITDEGL